MTVFLGPRLIGLLARATNRWTLGALGEYFLFISKMTASKKIVNIIIWSS
jgi:hypothetical protein